MNAEVNEVITVMDPSSDLRKWCKDSLTISNPDYVKKVRMGLWAGSTPKEFALYYTIGDKLVLPFGCAKKLRETFPDIVFSSKIKVGAPFEYDADINLYSYQASAVEASLTAKNGVLVMPCGAGKTQTGLQIVSSLGVRALWLTHTQDLLNQSMDRAKAVLRCPKSSYGTITGGKVNVGEGLTFATVQTMTRLDLPNYRNIWSCVVVDECHKAVGSPTKVMQFYRVLSNLNCRYKFGLTATPKRADGLEQSMFALLGDVFYEVKRDAVANTTCPVKVRCVSLSYDPNPNVILAGDGTLNYSALVQDLTSDQKRFDAVVREISALPHGVPVLILANRVEYLEKLSAACNSMGRRSVCLSGMGQTKKAKEERKEILHLLNEGTKIDTVAATYQLAKEGLDVPALRYLVLATPEKDETTVAQAAGRVGRKFCGKECGEVIDFRDSFGMFVGWGKKRDSIYKKLGYDIVRE